MLDHKEKAEKGAGLLPRGEQSHGSPLWGQEEAGRAPGTPETTAAAVVGSLLLSAVAKAALPSTAAIVFHVLDSPGFET